MKCRKLAQHPDQCCHSRGFATDDRIHMLIQQACTLQPSVTNVSFNIEFQYASILDAEEPEKYRLLFRSFLITVSFVKAALIGIF